MSTPDTNIREIPPSNQAVMETSLRQLEEIKQEILIGNVTGMTCVIFFRGGRYRLYTSAIMNRCEKIGVLEEMKHELLNL